jgi:hypothetical protein
MTASARGSRSASFYPPASYSAGATVSVRLPGLTEHWRVSLRLELPTPHQSWPSTGRVEPPTTEGESPRIRLARVVAHHGDPFRCQPWCSRIETSLDAPCPLATGEPK